MDDETKKAADDMIAEVQEFERKNGSAKSRPYAEFREEAVARMSEVKACPFCGGVNPRLGETWIDCLQCGLTVSITTSDRTHAPYRVAAMWNRRASPPQRTT